MAAPGPQPSMQQPVRCALSALDHCRGSCAYDFKMSCTRTPLASPARFSSSRGTLAAALPQLKVQCNTVPSVPCDKWTHPLQLWRLNMAQVQLPQHRQATHQLHHHLWGASSTSYVPQYQSLYVGAVRDTKQQRQAVGAAKL
jgi:hypothetical protein